MTPEQIARQYSERPGYTLASYGEVGLPFYKIKTNCLMLEEKNIGAIDEFLLRSVAAGISELTSLGKVLGLDNVVLDARIGELIGSDDLSVRRDPDHATSGVQLTAKGLSVLSSATAVVPEEVLIEIDYDGLLRRPISFVDDWLTPRQLKDRGLREVPPSPTRPPQIQDIDMTALRVILKTAARGRHAKRELLTFRSIERRYLCFRPAVALVYKADDGGGAQIGFAIDGRLSPEHEHAFARALTKNRLASAISVDRSAEEVASDLLGEGIVRVADRRQTLALHRRIAEAEAGAQAASPGLLASDAQRELDSLGVRALETFEHPKYLRDALEGSQTRLLIISPWLRNGVVDDLFVETLETLLRRNVDVFIGWGISGAGNELADSDSTARTVLSRLAGKYSNFRFRYLGNTHAKVLLSDRRFVIVTSFNWLSYRGDPNRTFRDERGVLVAIADEVDRQCETLVEHFV